MERRTYNERLYQAFARVGKAAASPQRLRLLELLSQAPRTVESLAASSGMSVANTSQHLRTLREAGLVESERDGTYVVYRLAGPDVNAFLDAVRGLAESHIADVDRVRREYLESRDTMEAVDGDDLLRRVRGGEVTVLDVRPTEEYEASHVSGAISVPLGELKGRLRSLPTDRDVVAYCRGPYCVLALDAVDLLRKHGIRAFRLEDGVHALAEKGVEMVFGKNN